ncbi:hypothetical protein EPUL_002361 [Erysiphe pulchra]|uniref:Uncharacterized protein n=1 Tax=Erysiphe pulchra TaxID=225359 RepID=A0A2S4PSN2_9PEZI|nr:hypothetical protein EPUL_002361 [Erysiphe pulchra]
MPKFIITILNFQDSVTEIFEYLASFDVSKLNPAWVKLIKLNNISPEAVNRLGLGIAGYKLVSVFNIMELDIYDVQGNSTIKSGPRKRPYYLIDAVLVAKSFRIAGYCWDFNPATIDPNLIAKFRNINKNASNLLTEYFKPETLKHLLEIKKFAVLPTFELECRTWNKPFIYKATSPIILKRS